MIDILGAPLQVIQEMLDVACIPFMIVGSFASMVHGEPRTTQDLDIVIDPTAASLDAFLAAINPDRFYVDADVARDALRHRSMFNLIDMLTAWKADIVRKDRVFSVTELARRAPAVIFDIEVPVATAEDTIIAKLEWAKEGTSDRQLRDVAGMLRVRGDQIDFAYVEQWIQTLGLREQWSRAKDLAK